MQQLSPSPSRAVNGGRFDFDDGGTYCGGWEDGKAHGHGVCTGPKGQGEYSGSWHFGFEVSGVYTWPSGSTFEGQWQNGKRHGLGVETRGRWLYRGEWTQGFKGRYGVRQSSTSNAKYEGTWANGLQDGYGSETYADGGTYQGQWLRGMRHGYGVRASAPFGLASHYRPNKPLRASLTSLRSDAAGDPAAERDRKVDDGRGGFVLKARSDEPPARRRSLVEKSSNFSKSILQGLKIRKQRSTGDLDKRGTSASIRSTGSSASWVSTGSSKSAVTNASMHTDSNASFVVEDDQMDASVTETYMGEWKNDKRSGYGISERSDGLRYEGEWFNNKKYGYGVTTLKDGTREEGKYKNNVLITSQKKKHLFLIRSAKFRERIDVAVQAAQRASKIALQKADIAISRTATARGKAEHSDIAALHAREDSDIARITAKQFAPDFHQPGTDAVRAQLAARGGQADISKLGPIRPREEPSPHNHSKSMYVKPTRNEANPPEPVVTQPPPPPPEVSVKVPHANQPQFSQPYMNKVGPEINRLPNLSPPPPPPTVREPSVQPEEIQPPPRATTPAIQRAPKVEGEHPGHTFQQSMSDHFDHYKRPPSRDSSIDRYSRAAKLSRQPSENPAPASRATSRQRTPGFSAEPEEVPAVRKRGATPGLTTELPAGNGAVVGVDTGVYKVPSSPFEEVIIRQRGLGQDIIPSPGAPKRTESLYINPVKRREAQPKNIPAPSVLQRKKSLPDVQVLPKATEPMSREEVSVLSSMRREEVRRLQDEAERLRANPLLYLVSPHVKDWFSRQQLLMLVLFINISLAIMFFKLLT